MYYGWIFKARATFVAALIQSIITSVMISLLINLMLYVFLRIGSESVQCQDVILTIKPTHYETYLSQCCNAYARDDR